MSAPPTMIIGPATADDLESIMVVERRGFLPREAWTERAWAEELTGADRTVLVAREPETAAVLGVISVQTQPPTSDLMRLVVDPEFRRMGVARALIEDGVSAAARQGARKMLLEVAFDNDGAIACYGHCRFEQLTTREHYYGRGRHAMIMKRYDLEAAG